MLSAQKAWGCISEVESKSRELKYSDVLKKLLDPCLVVYILILATQTLRQENFKSEANLGSLARFFLKLNMKCWGKYMQFPGRTLA